MDAGPSFRERGRGARKSDRVLQQEEDNVKRETMTELLKDDAYIAEVAMCLCRNLPDYSKFCTINVDFMEITLRFETYTTEVFGGSYEGEREILYETDRSATISSVLMADGTLLPADILNKLQQEVDNILLN